MEFTFKLEADQTAVVWSMAGKRMDKKFFHLFIDMDEMVGGDFEKGSSAAKSVVEAAPTQANAVKSGDAPPPVSKESTTNGHHSG